VGNNMCSRRARFPWISDSKFTSAEADTNKCGVEVCNTLYVLRVKRNTSQKEMRYDTNREF
jgi:hypothetical protein